jgi:outer membrane protein TolC/membrane protein DedA with SNARE-associated domain
MNMNYATQYFMTHAIAVLFVCVLAEQSGLPIPSVPVLLAAGSQASAGRVSPIFSIAVALVACLTADSFWYQVGRRRRSKLPQESAQIAPQPRSWISRTIAACGRHQAGALLLAKFLPGPNLASPLAGISGLTRSRFLIFDSMASFVWAGGYITVGYFFSTQLQRATAYGSHLAMALLLVLFVAFFLAKVLRCRWPRWSGRAPVLIPFVLLCFAPLAAAQGYSAGGGVASASIAGSVPSGPATDGLLRLTLRDAINMALRYNLGAIESGENVQTARGQRLIALSYLLPQVSAGLSETVGQTSLATFGVKNSPFVPNILGPYSYGKVDASLSQTLFSLESIQRFRSARTAEQAAQISYQDILDVVTLAVGNAYLQVIETSSRIEAQQAQVRNALALYDQAEEEYHAGTSPRIDATRTEVQLHTEEYNLSVACNNLAIAQLTLARAIGLPLGQAFEIADQLPYSDINTPTIEDALQTAYKSRSDFRASLDSQKAAQQTLSAAKGERYPVVAMNGDYSDVGTTFGHSHGNFDFLAGVSVPIFTGGRIKGDITQAEAALRQRKAEAENARGQLDYDVRTAFLNLNAAKEQVDVAQRNVALANENLAHSKDRFTSGVTDSVEVVQSEQSLASANDQYITSVYNHNLAKLTLARAMGVARTSYKQYLGGK